MNNMDDMVDEIENICLYEIQHLPGGGKYFSRGEIDDLLLIAAKQVLSLDDIPEVMPDITGSRIKVVASAAAMALRRLASDALSSDTEKWRLDLMGETTSDRIKTAGMWDSMAKDYEDALREMVP